MKYLAALFFAALAIMMATTTMAQQTPQATVTPARKVVVVMVGETILEQSDPLDIFGGGQGAILHDLIGSVRDAASDDSTAAMVVRFESPGWGWAQAMEFRDALMDFRATGKPLYISADMLGMVDYTVATAGTEIVMPPVGALDLHGLSFSLYYFRDLLAKLGIEAQVVNEGRYKDAFDPFLRSEMSEGTREQMTALADDLFSIMRTAIVETREVPEEKAEEILTGGPYSSRKALDVGAIDRLVYHEDLESLIEEEMNADVRLEPLSATGEKKPVEPLNLMSLLMGSTGSTGSGSDKGSKIALVYALGPIIDGRVDRSNPFFMDQMIASEDFIDLIDEVASEPNLRAVVLRVDSPGGSAIASDRIWNRLEQLQADGIPVIVSMGNVAASGGYYISMGADRIVAESTTITGSIGVIGGKLNMADTYAKIGVARQSIAIGPHSDLYSETTEWSPEDKALLMEFLDSVYDDFTRKAAEGRGTTQDEIRKVAEGRIWSGMAAKDVGLVDELGGLDRAIEIARELSSSPDAKVVSFPKEITLMEFVQKILSGDVSIHAPVSSSIQSADPTVQAARLLVSDPQLHHLAFMIGAMRDRPTVMAVMPYTFEFD